MREVERHMRELSTGMVLVSAKIAKRLGVTPTDVECLELLERTGPMTAGQLATATGLTTGAITGVIDRLERAGFVSRQPDLSDRRRVIVALNDDRVAVDVVPMYAPISELLAQLCDTFTDEQLRTVARFLEQASLLTEPMLRAVDETPARRAGRGKSLSL